MNKADIETALKTFVDNQKKSEKFRNYYDGKHDLAFATDKFKTAFGELFKEFALNLCPAVCDALKDKLIIENFRVESGDNSIPIDAWEIWQSNRMDKRSGEIHKEAIVMGDAYAQVWIDSNQKVTIYPQKADRCFVVYDEEIPGKILWSAKYWKIPDKRIRLNLFYPDRAEKYISKKPFEQTLPQKAAEFVSYTLEGSENVANPYNIVPIFHFANNADTGSLGKSELADAIAPQNALNKTVMDLLVTSEFASFMQKWATGIESNYDDEGNPVSPFLSGVEKLWTTENYEAKFGVFPATDLTQFLKVKDSFIIDMARATGTPLWYFIQTEGGFPSGEALKKSETRYINKVKDRMQSFGQTWEELMSFALLMENKGKDLRLFTDWINPEPVSRKEELENIVIEKEIGISDEQALIEAGYGESDIIRMLKEKQAKADAAINAFNAGEDDVT